MKVDEKRLKEIEAREQGAQPGPWFACPPETGEMGACGGVGTSPGGLECDSIISTDGGYNPPNMPTAQFIAHARTDVPDLVADLREARAALDPAGLETAAKVVEVAYPNLSAWLREAAARARGAKS